MHRIYWKQFLIEDHFLYHGVTPEEAEEVLESNYPKRHGSRFFYFGATSSGRLLFIVAEEESEGVLVPLSGREMTEREKKAYRKNLKKR